MGETAGESTVDDSSSQTPPLTEEEAPFQHINCLGTNKNMIIDSDGARNKK
jgi:hypothetical protein